MNKRKSKNLSYFSEFWKYRDLLKVLVLKDIKLKYRRSFLGYAWSILNPLFVMVIMTIVFSTMFSRDIDNFPVYLFCGQLLFNYMSTSTHQAIFSITGNAALLKKTYLPRYLFTVSKITSGLVDLIFSLGALVIVIIITRARMSWHALLVPFVLLQLYIFCIGLGLFLAQANVFFRDSQFIYNAVTTAWLYLTCIFYPISSLPEWLSWGIEHFNPVYCYVWQFRDIIHMCQMPNPKAVILGSGYAVLMLVLGLWSFARTKDKFILYI